MNYVTRDVLDRAIMFVWENPGIMGFSLSKKMGYRGKSQSLIAAMTGYCCKLYEDDGGHLFIDEEIN